MDFFNTFKSNSEPVPRPAATVNVSSLSKPKIVTVALEKIKNRTVTAIYNIDITLDRSIKTPEEFLSKLKKSVCNSNGFIRKPVTESDSSSDDDADADADAADQDDSSSTEEEPTRKPKEKPNPDELVYVINGNHSNTLCKYIYGLGVKSIIRTGTA